MVLFPLGRGANHNLGEARGACQGKGSITEGSAPPPSPGRAGQPESHDCFRTEPSDPVAYPWAVLSRPYWREMCTRERDRSRFSSSLIATYKQDRRRNVPGRKHLHLFVKFWLCCRATLYLYFQIEFTGSSTDSLAESSILMLLDGLA